MILEAETHHPITLLAIFQLNRAPTHLLSVSYYQELSRNTNSTTHQVRVQCALVPPHTHTHIHTLAIICYTHTHTHTHLFLSLSFLLERHSTSFHLVLHPRCCEVYPSDWTVSGPDQIPTVREGQWLKINTSLIYMGDKSCDVRLHPPCAFSRCQCTVSVDSFVAAVVLTELAGASPPSRPTNIPWQAGTS